MPNGPAQVFPFAICAGEFSHQQDRVQRENQEDEFDRNRQDQDTNRFPSRIGSRHRCIIGVYLSFMNSIKNMSWTFTPTGRKLRA